MIETYLSTRQNLLGLVLLIDIRRGPEKEEFEFINWLMKTGIEIIIVFTKADKLSKPKQQKALAPSLKKLNLQKEDIILFSAKSRLGKDQLLKKIEDVINYDE